VKTEAELQEVWGAERFPPFVATPEQRRRWDICHHLAATISEVNEPSGVADGQFVWHMERWLYQSELPTDEVESPPGQP